MPETGSATRSRPRVKVCGVTRADDAVAAARLGADLIGLNFYPPSPRYLDQQQARRLVAAIAADAAARGARRPLLVGVFVDEPIEHVEATLSDLDLDLAQLHGDEGPEAVARLGRRAIQALRVDGRVDPSVLGAELADATPWGYLIDAKHPQLYGGSGTTWAFDSLTGVAAARPVLIAGGLGPRNVGAALEASGAWGVDVCSGIESAPGIKDLDRMTRFFQAIPQETPHGTSAVAS